MEKAKVYFTDFRTTNGIGLPEKLKKLCRKAGMQTMDMDGKFVAIKIHFGELGNIAYLRPNYAKAVADLVKEIGGKPFLTDCNTLYPGSRKNALEHLDCAQENGFNETTTGCHVIIADGLRGTDDVIVPVEGAEYCPEAYIGRAVMDADVFISLNHFKGHECTGFGGALKNIGLFASFDPVALDQACVDACLKADPMPNSQLSDNLKRPGWYKYSDNFTNSNPNVRWKETLEHAEKIGIGTREYELIKL